MKNDLIAATSYGYSWAEVGGMGGTPPPPLLVYFFEGGGGINITFVSIGTDVRPPLFFSFISSRALTNILYLTQ